MIARQQKGVRIRWAWVPPALEYTDVVPDDDECVLGTFTIATQLGPISKCRNILGSYRCELVRARNKPTVSTLPVYRTTPATTSTTTTTTTTERPTPPTTTPTTRPPVPSVTTQPAGQHPTAPRVYPGYSGTATPSYVTPLL
ncbi:hypothetical protein NQ318_003425 [Aromia moschata]|uniref:Uncharacterized protein n=1 Tax=Aromia moschata TaxID=1265417 RepID=A0AAV8YV16_9CUCU|nr:hypothetical protein NQ318_003425 [Aromia moschata]